MLDDYQIVEATKEDFNGIMKFLMSDFLHTESLNAALKYTEEEATDFFAELVHAGLEHPISYLAKSSSGEIIGCNISSIMHRPTEQQNGNTPQNGDTETTTHQNGESHTSVFENNISDARPVKVQQISRFVSALESRIWDLVPTGTDTLLTCIIISVSKNWTRRGIAKKLIEANYEKAKELGCQGTFTECSAKASQIVFSKLGYEEVYCIKHEDWIENGERVFYCSDGTDKGSLMYKSF